MLLAVGILIFSAQFLRATGFSWDEANTERLFLGSDGIFAGLQVDEDEKLCVSQFRSLVDDLKGKKAWALTVMDSWAKEPAGLFSGVTTDFGHFDQCVGVSFHQHCQIGVENSQMSYKMGLCVPRSCEKRTLAKVLRPFLANVQLQFAGVGLCNDDGKPQFSWLQWVALIICIALILVPVGSTVYELVGGRGFMLTCSLHKNTNRLFEVKESFGPMACLNGIRVFSMLWIVLLHSYHEYMFTFTLYDPKRFSEFTSTFTRALVHHADLAVDTFFVIGGLLLAHGFLRSRERGDSFNVFKYISHRWLRLVPIVALTILIWVAFSEYVANGPKAYTEYLPNQVGDCKKYWWSALLLIQNYFNIKNICLGHSWYISADFQLYVLSPLILFPLFKWGKRCLYVMAIISLASMAHMFSFILEHKELHFNNFRNPTYTRWIYYPSHARITQWLIGLALGFVLWKLKDRPVRLRRSLNLALWILAIGTMWSVIVVAWTQVRDQTENNLGFAFWASTHRQLWALAVAWVIFACVKGYGGPVNWFLSFPIFQPLAKLSYAIYIVHLPLKYTLSTFQRSLAYFSMYIMFHLFLGLLGLSVLVSVLLVLVVEMPVANVEAEAYRKAARTTIKQ